MGVMLFEESPPRLIVMLKEEEVIERPEWKVLNGGGDNLGGGLLSDSGVCLSVTSAFALFLCSLKSLSLHSASISDFLVHSV